MHAQELSIDDLRNEMYQQHEGTKLEEVAFKQFTVVESFSTLFADWELRDKDLLIHLFPRNGEEDVYFEGRYLPRCRACKREVPVPEQIRQIKPCPHCGHTGLIYQPGRLEQRSTHSFPENMPAIIELAGNEVWAGDAMYDFVEELGAYVVLFIEAGTIQGLADDGGLLDRFLAKVDEELG